ERLAEWSGKRPPPFYLHGRLAAQGGEATARLGRPFVVCAMVQPDDSLPPSAMRIQTFSILAGSETCNARRPFCISKMTPPLGVELHAPAVNWRNFCIACRLAERCGVTTAMITGKGEPTLFPAQVTRYLQEMASFAFPIVELQ